MASGEKHCSSNISSAAQISLQIDAVSRMSRQLQKYGLDDFTALKQALQCAAENKSEKVLERIPFVLGNLLNAAISEGDILTASYLIKAGAKVNFGVNYFYTPKDAFYHYAALAYFRRAQQDFLVPCEEDVMQGYLQLISSCKQCDHSTSDLNLFNNHIGQYIEFPLLVAVQQQNIEAIQLLLDCGAQKEIDCGNYRGESHTTPFSLCITSGFLEGVEAFLKRGININKVVSIGSFQDYSEEILEAFLRAGLFHRKISRNSALAIAAGKEGRVVPQQQQEPPPLSLKFICREVIREAILKSRPENLFIHITKSRLGLPHNLCRYLLCEFDVRSK